MKVAQVPAHLGEAITMEINELKNIINGLAPSSMVLTRSNTKMLKNILISRSENKFDYGQLKIIKTENEDDEDWTYIMMNPYIKSPQHWLESDFKELRD